MKVDLILFPCNGNAIEALDCINSDYYNVLGFVDDSTEKIGQDVLGLKIYPRSFLDKNPSVKILAVPGSPKSFTRREYDINELNTDRDRFVTVVHPTASVSPAATIGYNCLIMEGVVIKPLVQIGNNVCILPNTVVHHHSTVGDFTMVGSGVIIAGHTKVSSHCYVGSGTSIMDNLEIGSNTLIGLGSNVIRNVASGQKIVGNPASTLV